MPGKRPQTAPVLGVLAVVLAAAAPPSGPPHRGAALATASADVPLRPLGLPLAFEPLPDGRYLARVRGGTVEIAAAGLRLRARDGGDLRLTLAGARQDAPPVGEAPLPGRVHYLLGRDPRAWRVHVPRFAAVRVSDVYPGIDLRYRERRAGSGELEFDFLLTAGADPRFIRLVLGAGGPSERPAPARLGRDGSLLAGVGAAAVRLPRPACIQDGRPISARFALHQDGTVGVAPGRYDPARPLWIDPGIVFATYLGGSAADGAYGVACDGRGALYVTGDTQSGDFPGTAGGAQARPGGGTHDAMVARLAPDGRTLEYATFIGGRGIDAGFAVAVDERGAASVVGVTGSPDFPITSGAAFPTLPDEGSFVLRLKPDGSGFEYSTFLPGASMFQIAAAPGGEVVVGGYGSTGLPTTPGALQPQGRGAQDVAIARLSADGSAIRAATYLGGQGSDLLEGLALAPDGSVAVGGITFSRDFPTTPGAFDRVHSCCADGFEREASDGFVSRLSADATRLEASTLLGGVKPLALGLDQDYVSDVEVAADGDLLACGHSFTEDFPTTDGAAVRVPDPNGTAFAVRLSADAGTARYSTFLPTSFDARSIALGAGEEAVVLAGSRVLRLAPDGRRLLCETAITPQGLDMALTPNGAAAVCGSTGPDLETTAGAFQPRNAGETDAFVALLDLAGPALSPPAELRLLYAGPTGARLRWSAATGSDRIEVERAAAGVEFSVIASLPATATDYLDSSASPGQSHRYRLRAGNACGPSPPTPELAVTIPAGPSGRLTVSPVTLKFGKVQIGTPVERSLRLKNVGAGPAAVLGASVPAPFSLPGPEVTVVPPRRTVRLVVRAAPSATGPLAGTLGLETNDPRRRTLTIRLTGKAVAPASGQGAVVPPPNASSGTRSRGEP